MNIKKDISSEEKPMTVTSDDLNLIARTIRTLTMDAIQKANSGHPGMPMGCAEIAAVLWSKILNHNYEDPKWPNRDRFILSAGHGSMLLYAMLHFSGYGITMDDIKDFRQLNSLTPGHPEHTKTPGVETTTGPLGQGFANGVGMALARDLLAAEFNTNGDEIIDHYIYGIVSDGDIMEGLSAEAASLAGHIGLGNLIYIYDSNDITIEGDTGLTFSEDVGKRFEACNWHVQTIDGHDTAAIEKAVLKAQLEKTRPSLIIAKTVIAKGAATLSGCEDAHGAPLGDEEVCASKVCLGCEEDSYFDVPERVYEVFNMRNAELKKTCDLWQERFKRNITGERKKEWDKYFSMPDIAELRKKLPAFDPDSSMATRSASGKVLEMLYNEMPNILGGSADLGPSNKSLIKNYSETGKNRIGRNIHFGIREHAMGSIQNGIAYYGGFYPYAASFFVFMDYMRPAIRIAAMGKLKTVYIFTHDSIFVGEDGPTHQPVEQLAASRAIPNLTVVRPADAVETAEAWMAALGRNDGPTMLVLTRQNVPAVIKGRSASAENLRKGAYVIRECAGDPDIVIFATGSEVHISVEAAVELEAKGIQARVVSFPSWELFDAQPADYRKDIIAHGVPKCVVEAGISMGWERYAGNHALFITMERFGVSAPYKVLEEVYGFNTKNIVTKVEEFLRKK